MRLLAPFLALSLLATTAGAASPTTLKVVITGDDGEDVNLSVPLDLAGALASMAPLDAGPEGRLTVGDREIRVSELRTLWAEVKKSGDAELATVKDEDGTVKVSSKGGHVLVDVRERGASSVRVDLPHAIVDALLSGKGDQLDLAAAVAKLKDMDAGEIVRVDDGADRIRITLE